MTQAFQIRYRNTQGTLMRILNAVSRRALDMPSVHAEAAGQDHQVTLTLDVTPKQVGQLSREWYSIADVIHVGSSAAVQDHWDSANSAYGAWTAQPPASTGPGREEARAALA